MGIPVALEDVPSEHLDRHPAGGLAAAMSAESVRDDQQDLPTCGLVEAAEGILIHAAHDADVCGARDSRLVAGPDWSRGFAVVDGGQGLL